MFSSKVQVEFGYFAQDSGSIHLNTSNEPLYLIYDFVLFHYYVAIYYILSLL
jgi:hypothetical protein